MHTSCSDCYKCIYITSHFILNWHVAPLSSDSVGGSQVEVPPQDPIKWRCWGLNLWSSACIYEGRVWQNFPKNTQMGQVASGVVWEQEWVFTFLLLSAFLFYLWQPQLINTFYQEYALSFMPHTIIFKLFNLVSFMEDTLSRNVVALNILSACQCFSRVLDEMVLVVLRSSLLGVW